MSERTDQTRLQDGTLIRHKIAGYEGRIDGTTGIKRCFTSGGKILDNSKQTFQYRVVITGETMRRIAPAEDLEILEGVAEIVCPRCQSAFQSRPGFADKPGGRCQCGGWICPTCLGCQQATQDSPTGGRASCASHRKRLARRLALQKKSKAAG